MEKEMFTITYDYSNTNNMVASVQTKTTNGDGTITYGSTDYELDANTRTTILGIVNAL